MEVVELPGSTRTAVEAAQAVGCQVGQIVKSLVFKSKHSQRPIRPAEATDAALWHHIRGYTRDKLEALYDQTLSATPAGVKRVMLAQLEANAPKAAVCVLSSRSKLEEANLQSPERPMAIEDLIKE